MESRREVYTEGPMSADSQEEILITAFLDKPCGCMLGSDDSPCSKKFSRQCLQSYRDSCAELSHNELDIMVMA